MKKNIIIAALLFVVIMCWIKVDPECIKSDDPNSVVIEYECNSLDDYDNVPPEVVEECRGRANDIINRNKPKI
jgi:hypothetical protein